MTIKPTSIKLAGLVVALLLAVCLGGGARIWASTLTRPERQTVPLTPPATWTPNVPRPTQPAPATRRPRPTSASSSSPYPFLELTASPFLLAPGLGLEIELSLQNAGNAPLSEATVVLASPDVADSQQLRTSAGATSLLQGEIVWRVTDLAPDETVTMNLSGAIRRDVQPGRQILLQATVLWEGGQDLSNQVLLTLPNAILPATGQ